MNGGRGWPGATNPRASKTNDRRGQHVDDNGTHLRRQSPATRTTPEWADPTARVVTLTNDHDLDPELVAILTDHAAARGVRVIDPEGLR